MAFWDDIANAVVNVANQVVQTFVPGAPPLPPPPFVQPPPSHGSAAVTPAPQPPPGGYTVPPSPSSGDRFIVLDLIDVLQKPPPQINAEYVKIVARVASWVGAKAVGAPTTEALRNAWTQSKFPEQATGTSSGTTMIGGTLNSSDAIRNAVNKARNDVLDVATQIGKIVALSHTDNFTPSENPFSLASAQNTFRLGFQPLQISNELVAQIAGNMRTYLDFLGKMQGASILEQTRTDAAQLSSATLSLEGFGGSGNTSVDLGRLTPEQEAIRRQKALDALSVLDFKKRVPQALFTAEYRPDGKTKGCIIGWKRVPDASGYVLTRRSILEDKVVTYTVTNDDAKRDTARLKDYVDAWILSFYDNIQKDAVVSFLDTGISSHQYYHYQLQAYQLQNTNPGAIFSVETSPVFFSQAQKAEIRRQMEIVDPNTGPDLISPYPIICQAIFGDANSDWLLAALNSRASINRNESRGITRQYSYLSAQLDFLFAQADAGRFVAPKGRDFSVVFKNIQDAISKFGVNQLIKVLMQETGAIYHFDGSEPVDDAVFKKVGDTDPDDSALLRTIASAIDPETATINLRTLASNVPIMLAGQLVESPTPGSKASVMGAISKEIVVPGDVDGAPEVNVVEETIPFLSKLGNLSKAPVDLTTVEGLGTLMRVIRIFSDYVEHPELIRPTVVPFILPLQTALAFGTPTAASPQQPVLPPPPPLIGGAGVPNATSNDPITVANQIAKNLAQGNVQGAVDAAAKAAEKAAQDVGKAVEDAFRNINIKL